MEQQNYNILRKWKKEKGCYPLQPFSMWNILSSENYYGTGVIETIRSSMSEKLMPAAFAACGSRLVLVIPGMVLVSRIWNVDPSRMKSERDIPLHPSASWASRAIACIFFVIDFDKLAGVISWLPPPTREGQPAPPDPSLVRISRQRCKPHDHVSTG